MSRHPHRTHILTSAILLITFTVAGPNSSGQLNTALLAQSADKTQAGSAGRFALNTTAFSAGAQIPKRYRCDGEDLSPALTWKNSPAGTQSFALIADDPDAPVGTWTHWILWNIPAKTTALPGGVPKVEESVDGARQGKNDFKRIGYGGPCPPPGKPHRYFFKLYALDAKLDVKAGATRNEMEGAMKGHVLAEADWMGMYGR